MEVNATKALADFVTGLTYEEIPPNTVTAAKEAVMDHLGAALFASQMPWSRIVVDYVRSCGSSGKSTIYGHQIKASAPHAALANGTMAHGFELDDVVLDSLTHHGACVIPAALTIGEQVQTTGKEVLTAVVAGYEVGSRLGRCVGLAHLLRGFHPTGTNGVFGATTSAGRLLGLDSAKITHAYGIAASLASGVSAFAHDPKPGMIKRLHGGRAAEGGVTAAVLASLGFEAPQRGIDGRQGYVETFGDNPNKTKLWEQLGTSYALDSNLLKPYACCAMLHPAVDAVLSLKASHRFPTEGIREIIVKAPRQVVEQNSVAEPEDVLAAQYSVQFAVAAALAKDIINAHIFNQNTVNDPLVRALMSKITLLYDEGLEKLLPAKAAAAVLINLEDGRVLEATVTDALGSAGNPMSADQTEEKFRRLATSGLGKAATDRVVELVWTLEKHDVSELTSLLSTYN